MIPDDPAAATPPPSPPAPLESPCQLLVEWLRREWRWVGRGLVLLLVLGLGWHWLAARPIASRGGFYFPVEVILPVPHFAQGDPKWGSDLLGPTEATLHAEGCAVASAAMVMSAYGVDLDPGTLNTFLSANEGYTPEGWIYWEKAAEFQPGVAAKAYEDLPAYARIDLNLLIGNPVIVRVRMPNNNHFVVIAGKRGREYLIADPGAPDRGLYRLSELAPRIEALRYYQRLQPQEKKEPPVTASPSPTPLSSP